MEIDTGDSVLHGPTGETWVVAYVDGDRLAWCGWPPGEAMLSDCKLVEKATPEYRDKLLRDMAEMRLDPEGYDRRKSMAQYRLSKQHSAESGAPRREAGDRAGPLVSRQPNDSTGEPAK